MRERPILFSGAMVRAILDGRKTQTRRVVRGVFEHTFADGVRRDVMLDWDGKPTPLPGPCERTPFRAPGTRIWVREAFRPWFDDDEFDVVQYRADGSVRKPDGLTEAQGYHFHDECQRATDESPWRPSIFMPRWASRLTLEVEAVRVERVQDTSASDAEAEGVERVSAVGPCRAFGWRDYIGGPGFFNPRESFRSLWNSINAKRGFGWDANPWVWVVTFKRVEAQHGR